MTILSDVLFKQKSNTHITRVLTDDTTNAEYVRLLKPRYISMSNELIERQNEEALRRQYGVKKRKESTVV